MPGESALQRSTPGRPQASGYGFPYTLDPGVMRSIDSLTLTANNCIFSRVEHGGTISKIGVLVAAQSGNVSVAAYANSGTGRSAVPGTRLATSGAVACPAVGYAEISLGGSVHLEGGDWLAISADNATAAFRSLLNNPMDTGMGAGRQYRQATAHPAPASPSGLIATIGWTIVLVGVA